MDRHRRTGRASFGASRQDLRVRVGSGARPRRGARSARAGHWRRPACLTRLLDLGDQDKSEYRALQPSGRCGPSRKTASPSSNPERSCSISASRAKGSRRSTHAHAHQNNPVSQRTLRCLTFSFSLSVKDRIVYRAISIKKRRNLLIASSSQVSPPRSEFIIPKTFLKNTTGILRSSMSSQPSTSPGFRARRVSWRSQSPLQTK